MEITYSLKYGLNKPNPEDHVPVTKLAPDNFNLHIQIEKTISRRQEYCSTLFHKIQFTKIQNILSPDDL